MTKANSFRGHNLNNPADYPARYETDWLRRRPRRAIVRTVVALVAFGALVYPLGWQGALAVALLAGVLHFAYVWRRHFTATAWHKEGYAERRSARVLLPVEKQGYLILHDHFHGDVRLETLMIGPTGVWLVYAVGRATMRRLWGDAAFLHPEKQPVALEPEELRERADALGQTLTAEAGEPVTVRPLYLAVNEDLPESVRGDPLVPVVSKGQFRSHLAGEPTRLSRDAIDRLTRLAVATLPPRRPDKNSPPIPPMAVKKSLWSQRKGLQFVRETEVGGRPRRGARRRDG